MKAKAIKRHLCVCTECEPLPPIEGLHPETVEATGERPDRQRRSDGLFRSLAERIVPFRKPS
ncbi:hypothetical protein [Rhizobium ruizarguesonis]|jgi:hypothetical protein|uniref:Uncharacterized protein n=1 Tax=Rhizobium ruizarguesonis TaxID=2081791 RepID=A0AB38I1C8_9HYPH|nr:hypothetical protein [Rhizobium ruizarguesonis]NEI04907.1 hypothetical protein [Rhizobium ruizarguesonis]NEI28890.1 hypothetical protein [Rhizobium ruizarguesonis]TAY94755.1 hypothetical protein ELH85_16970 [Rhizobium ruizarguesonis]TAZ79158.1 hypothetical protein ELH68_15890 [Rhizobium ruizarguesonis]TBA05536.1 hypothetical protein ELH64_14385 [Rhizobium ruizarguesonis]